MGAPCVVRDSLAITAIQREATKAEEDHQTTRKPPELPASHPGHAKVTVPRPAVATHKHTLRVSAGEDSCLRAP